MANILNTNERWFELDVPEAPAPLRILHCSGTEGISEPFHFSFHVESDALEMDPSAIIGTAAEVLIYSQGFQRSLSGIVTRLEFSGVERHVALYNIDVAAELYLLSQQVRSRIFQDMTLIEILSEVLKIGGLNSDNFRFACNESYDPLEYCVQYRESDLDFFNRLTEDSGLHYYFEDADGKTRLAIGDTNEAFRDIDGDGTVLFHYRRGVVEHVDYVSGLSLSNTLISNKHTMRDFNFTTPLVDLTKSESVDGLKPLECYDYPANVKNPEQSARIAKIRSEGDTCQRSRGVGNSNSVRLVPGHVFSLTGHPVDSLNTTFLVTKTVHYASQPAPDTDLYGQEPYHNTFHLQLSSQPFRPALRTRRPAVAGSQTAIVTGPDGEEIYCDEYGRIRVRFHWDRSGSPVDKTSCWIRVAQVWAGNQWGGMIIPRIGQEVIVDFLEGNPDRPIVTGSVYNASNMPPYDLPGKRTRSTLKTESSIGGSGFNELRFEDQKNSEEIFLHAQKDFTLETLNNRAESIGNDETHSVKRNRTRTVGENEMISIEGNRTVTIEKDLSTSVSKSETRTVSKDRTTNIGKKEQLDVGDNMSVSVGKSVNKSVGENQEVSIGKNLKISVGKDYGCSADQSILLTSDKDISLTCGSASIILKKNGDIQIKGKSISVKGSSKVMIKGSQVTQN